MMSVDVPLNIEINPTPGLASLPSLGDKACFFYILGI
jgi:hypothetical protein